MKTIILEELFEGNCYHICTNGEESPIIMRDEEDFRTALNYLAITSWKTKTTIVAFCLMSNHIHTMCICRSREQAEQFIKLFKQSYSTYLKRKYGLRKALHKIKDSISLIDTIQYFRNCIAYILRNSISAKVCKKIEDYPWSSYFCYFRDCDEDYRSITSMGPREIRRVLKTRPALEDCPFTINMEGMISPRSFIAYEIVEKAFINSGRLFLFHLGTCNDALMEYEMACKPLLGVNDTDLLSSTEKIAASKFNGKKIAELTNQQKCSIIKTVFFNNKTSIPQLSRVLGLPRDIISRILSS